MSSSVNSNGENSENILEKIYYDPSSPGSYGGVNRLLREVNQLLLSQHMQTSKNKFKPISRHTVQRYLQKQDAYTLIRPSRRRFKRNPYLVKSKGYQYASDLMDLSSFSEYNDGYKWLLIVMDIYSRYVFIYLLKSKSAFSVLSGVKSIMEESYPLLNNSYPKKFETDLGGEYWNKPLQNYFKSINVEHFSKGKSSHVERFIRTFAPRIFRHQTKHNTRRYIDVVQSLLKSYNHSIHRSINNTPHDIFILDKIPKQQQQHLSVKSASRQKKEGGFTFQVGDLVRLSRDPVTGNIFEKEAHGRWTEEIFIISRIIQKAGTRTMYSVVDQQQQTVKGNFYKEELQKIQTDLSTKAFEIDKIIKYRTRKGGVKEALIKWKGYPSSFNSWEPVTNIQDI
jgi:transposase InsO family protein